ERPGARHTAPVRTAVERPVVKHGEMAVGGRVNVQLDDVGAMREGGLHRGEGVFEKGVFRRMDAGGGAGVAPEALRWISLREAAVGEKQRVAVAGCEKGGVVEIDRAGEKRGAGESPSSETLHAASDREAQSGRQSGQKSGADGPRRSRWLRPWPSSGSRRSCRGSRWWTATSGRRRRGGRGPSS